MRQTLIILALLGAGFGTACSDDQSGQQGTSGGDNGNSNSELNLNTDDGSFSYKDKEGDSVSINEDKDEGK